jgi:hypothetical protein
MVSWLESHRKELQLVKITDIQNNNISKFKIYEPFWSAKYAPNRADPFEDGREQMPIIAIKSWNVLLFTDEGDRYWTEIPIKMEMKAESRKTVYTSNLQNFGPSVGKIIS